MAKPEKAFKKAIQYDIDISVCMMLQLLMTDDELVCIKILDLPFPFKVMVTICSQRCLYKVIFDS